MLEATNSWSVNIDNGFINGVVFIDLKKAFDTIDHKILLRKLACYGVDQKSLRWFDSYLSDRQQKCLVNGELSGARPVTCGVPQGSLIGPLLFLIYINDLPNCLSKASPRMYADDTSISIAANSLPELEHSINDELVKESDPPTLHCAPVVVYERRGPQKLSFHDNASFKNSDRSKITNRREAIRSDKTCF